MIAQAQLRESARAAAAAGVDGGRALALAGEVLRHEARAVLAVADRLGPAFVAAIERLLNCRGRVVVTGIGKSGHVARKLAATLASTGTPAFFVHAAEASHGDLGMIAPGDVVVMLSHSGETEELTLVAPHLTRQGVGVIAITGKPDSALARAADIHLDAAVDAEAGPLGLAPTASTTAALALGDALALALLDARGFSSDDFARAHPGGALGRRLLTRVGDIMRRGRDLPVVAVDATLTEAIVEMSGKGMGMTAVVADDGSVAGIFTDGDLRRCLSPGADLARTRVAEVMTHNPRTIDAAALAVDCVERMEAPPKVLALLVVDARGALEGALHMHDLFRARVL